VRREVAPGGLQFDSESSILSPIPATPHGQRVSYHTTILGHTDRSILKFRNLSNEEWRPRGPLNRRADERPPARIDGGKIRKSIDMGNTGRRERMARGGEGACSLRGPWGLLNYLWGYAQCRSGGGGILSWLVWCARASTGRNSPAHMKPPMQSEQPAPQRFSPSQHLCMSTSRSLGRVPRCAGRTRFLTPENQFRAPSSTSAPSGRIIYACMAGNSKRPIRPPGRKAFKTVQCRDQYSRCPRARGDRRAVRYLTLVHGKYPPDATGISL